MTLSHYSTHRHHVALQGHCHNTQPTSTKCHCEETFTTLNPLPLLHQAWLWGHCHNFNPLAPGVSVSTLSHYLPELVVIMRTPSQNLVKETNLPAPNLWRHTYAAEGRSWPASWGCCWSYCRQQDIQIPSHNTHTCTVKFMLLRKLCTHYFVK